MAPLSLFEHPLRHIDNDEAVEHSYGPESAKQSLDTPAPKKSVAFNEVVHVQTTIHINDYTPEEVHDCWYNADEFMVIKANVRFAVSLLEQGVFPTTTDDEEREGFCRRAVECRTKANATRRRQLKMSAWLAVLEEQELQYENSLYGLGNDDNDEYHYHYEGAEYIARAYFEASLAASAIARATALQDQWEVECMQ